MNESSSQHLGVVFLKDVLIVQVLEHSDDVVHAIVKVTLGYALHALTQQQVAVPSNLGR